VLFSAHWAQNRFEVQCYLVLKPRAPAHGGLKNGVWPRACGGPVTPHVVKTLRTICNNVVAHVYAVAPQKYRVLDMELLFKYDKSGAQGAVAAERALMGTCLSA